MDDSGDLRGLRSQRVDDDTTRTSASEGLEEGEVEGETLLIVEWEDQVSVDLSHDQSGDSLNSDIGDEGDTSWTEEISLYCDKCHKWIPAGQLRGEQPSYLKGDNFFKFTCADCAEDGKEQFERMRLTWQQTTLSNRKGFHQPVGTFWHGLMGSDTDVDPCISSPYTSRTLKPFIRRDSDNKPPKFCLLAEIRAYPRRNVPDRRRLLMGSKDSHTQGGKTCMGKDVTLHVSASNPAMLLYQKFGFKTEEYILD
ncbi:cysteine-rich protein 2-binding protein-like isoform X1 [Huso huso]|uniref:Cysteine-rich protein 2-binding protein-like isoform X1 n=1 Tax=Huso huso TaxID=61971 RepID=A0ABR0ZYK0_HUSHU